VLLLAQEAFIANAAAVITGVIVLACEPRVPSWMGRNIYCNSEYSFREYANKF
jgi:hypothetical protein